MATTLDRTTKVNLGILGTLLGSAVGGAVYLTTLNSNVVQVSERMVDVKQAIDRNTAQLAHDGRTLAVLESIVKTLVPRVERLEKKDEK